MPFFFFFQSVTHFAFVSSSAGWHGPSQGSSGGLSPHLFQLLRFPRYFTRVDKLGGVLLPFFPDQLSALVERYLEDGTHACVRLCEFIFEEPKGNRHICAFWSLAEVWPPFPSSFWEAFPVTGTHFHFRARQRLTSRGRGTPCSTPSSFMRTPAIASRREKETGNRSPPVAPHKPCSKGKRASPKPESLCTSMFSGRVSFQMIEEGLFVHQLAIRKAFGLKGLEIQRLEWADVIRVCAGVEGIWGWGRGLLQDARLRDRRQVRCYAWRVC